MRAATAFTAAAREAGREIPPGLGIRLVKRIPAASGLGGGSSDAAAVLRILDRDLGPLPAGRLAALAAGLGSDVPFFLHGGAAIGRGRGERLEPLPPASPREVLLILPPARHETARVFAHVALAPRPVPPPGGLAAAVAALAGGSASALRAAGFNALLGPALAAYPASRLLHAEIERRLGRPAAMSGSGAALFDLPDPGEAADAVARLRGIDARVLLARGG